MIDKVKGATTPGFKRQIGMLQGSCKVTKHFEPAPLFTDGGYSAAEIYSEYVKSQVQNVIDATGEVPDRITASIAFHSDEA